MSPHHTPFHPGELAVQTRAGVREMAARVGQIIAPRLPPPLAAFLRTASVVAVGMADAEGRLWATMLVGAPGFITVLDAADDDGTPTGAQHVRVAARPVPGDALHAAITDPASRAAVGLVAIDFATRRRVRVNGHLAPNLAPDAGSFIVRVEEAYGNCPKYIQSRTIERGPHDAHTTAAQTAAPSAAARLSDAQIAWLARADTCFLASVGPTANTERADASHRGGTPGFLVVRDGRHLLIPDYSGNTMFNTLGNLSVDPRIGVVVPDFATGALLQLSGTATIDWRPESAASFPGAERMLVIDVERVREVAGAIPATWSAARPSPFNPPAPE